MSKKNHVDKGLVKELFKRKGVTSVGYGFKRVNGLLTKVPVIVVGVRKKLPVSALSASDIVPTVIAGNITDVVELDPKALDVNTGRFRPCPAGISIGHFEVTAGTLGCYVSKNGKKLILSNNHVLANQNDSNIGDPIIQPGSADGGTIEHDMVANLFEKKDLEFDIEIPELPSDCKISNFLVNRLNSVYALFGRKTRIRAVVGQDSDKINFIDAALGEPLDSSFIDDLVLSIGQITNEIVDPQLDMKLQKTGRTTGHTLSIVTQVDVSIMVNYGSKAAMFEDQFIAEGDNCSGPGDSGSLVLTMDRQRVGLLFAGDVSGSMLIANKYSSVHKILELD